jgi:glyoxylase-like metal-dependent hydrolase (beta-lactamase superfamily II)
MMGLLVEQLPELRVIRVSRWIFNCYLIRGDDDHTVVVDAGLPALPDDLESIRPLLSGPVRVITATHGHCDHVGGAAELARRHDASIYLPATTLTYLDGVRPRTPTLAKYARTWRLFVDSRPEPKAITGFVRSALHAGFGTARGMLWPGPAPTGGLTDGMPMPGASAWTVVGTPGHTDDSISLWNPHSRTLIAGDAIFTSRGRLHFAPDTVDVDAAHQTETRLRRLPVAHLLPGHGRPIHADPVWSCESKISASNTN